MSLLPPAQLERETVTPCAQPCSLLCVYLPVPLSFSGSRQVTGGRTKVLCPLSCPWTHTCLTSPSPGRLKPCQGTRRQGGFRPASVPTSPDLRAHPRLPDLDSPPLSFPIAGGLPPACLHPLNPGKKSSHLTCPKDSSWSHRCWKAFLGGPHKKHFPANLPISLDLFSTQTER